MKKMKNAMLVIAGGLLMITVATVSCKKSTPAPAPAGPTFSSITPSNDTVGKSVTITISGANLTGAAVTTTASGVTISNVVASASSITATLAASSGATVAPATLTVTTSAGSTTTTISIVAASVVGPFTIDGFTASGQVAASNLVANWPFDGNSVETTSGATGKVIAGGASMNGTVTYVTGQIGQAASFTDGALIYPPIPNLDSINKMQRYTVSMWVNMSGNNSAEYSNPSVGENGKESSLFQVNGDWFNDIWGLAAVDVKTNGGYGADTLAVGGEITQIDGNQGTNGLYVHTDDTTAVLYPRSNPAQYVPGNQWTFITETFDDGAAAGWTLKIYDNGKLLDSAILNPQLYLTTGETFTLNPFNGATPGDYAYDQVTFGDYDFGDDFTPPANQYAIGQPYGAPGLAANKAYWARGINGMIDDARVFNVVLSQGQINDLYQLGLHGK
jgi:hypothetical protein